MLEPLRSAQCMRDGNSERCGGAVNTNTVEIDHLVIVADNLAQGSAWCSDVLGVTPLPGGQHTFMGTHNRLLALSSAGFPRCYLEIIAIDPQAPAPARPRWFGMDAPALRAATQREPQLVHAMLRCTDLAAALSGLRSHGLNPGAATAAWRDTPNGRLHWQVAVGDASGQERTGGCPPLIQWGEVHPTDQLPASPLQLCRAAWGGLAQGALAIANVTPRALPGWEMSLHGPLGEVTLRSFTAWDD